MIWAEKIGLKAVATHFQISSGFEVIVTCKNGGWDASMLETCEIVVKHYGMDVTKEFLSPDSHCGNKFSGEDLMRIMVNIFKATVTG